MLRFWVGVVQPRASNLDPVFGKKIIVHFANYVSDERPFSMTLLSHTELSIFYINIVLLAQIILTLLMTAIFATALNIPNQIPMS